VAGISLVARVRFIFYNLFLICLCSNQTTAQYANLPFRHITPEDGLSQGVVTCILKDSHGFIWMTTYDGINRFDGVEVLSNDEIAPGLGIISTTNSIIEDSKGNIWLGSIEALIKFDYQQNRFFTYSHKGGSLQDKEIAKDSYYPSAEKEGMIFCSTMAFPRCYIFDSYKETFIPFFFQPIQGTDSIRPMPIPREATHFAEILYFHWVDREKGHAVSMMEQKSDQSWQWVTKHLVGVEGTPYTFRRNGDQFDMLCNDHPVFFGDEKKHPSIFYSFDSKTGRIISMYKADYQISWFERKDGLLYLSSQESGLHIVDEKSGIEADHIFHEPGIPDGLMANYINIFTIRDNHLWASSWGKGVDYAYLGGSLFTSHFSGKEAERFKTSNFIRGIVEDENGHFWCNVLKKGIIELNERLEYIRTLPGTENINSAGIFIDEQQVLYFGDSGVKTYEIRHNKFGKNLDGRNTDHPSPVNADFHYYTSDQSGNILCASMWGLYKKEKNKNDLTFVLADIPEFAEVQQFAYQDRHDQLFLYSAIYGVNIVRKVSASYERVYSFPETFIPRHVYEENDSILWMGTTAGLLQFNTASLKIIKWFTTKDGLSNNTVYAIAPDNDGRLWLSTNKGLCSYDLETQIIQQFTDYPGQQGREYNRHAVCVARDGRILFGGVNGITAVHPSFFNRKLSPPIVQFTSIHNDEEINPFGHDQLHNAKVLKAGSSLIEFHFLAIDYYNSKLCKLKYKMEGVDKAWKIVENPCSARYVNLKPGKYAFNVLASDSNGIWSEQGKTFYFEIAAFWWQTIWFRILVALSIIAVLYVWINLWLAQKWNEQKNKLEKELAILKEHERISADLHDDIGSTLSSISVYSELADKYYESRPEKSHEIVHKISVQTRELMTRIEDIIWSLKPHNPDKTTLRSRIMDYAVELLSGKNVGYTVDVNPDVDELLKDPFIRKNILLIIKEAIHNSAKYSKASLVGIAVNTTTENVEVRIEDNGIGIDVDIARNGNGLGNMKKRSEDIGGVFWLLSAPGKGTSIEVTIPMASIRHK